MQGAVVSLRLHIEPGGEKYFSFAKSKLARMKEFMQQFDLKLLSRWYLVKPGERIWVQSLRLPVQGVFLDWIRITVKTSAAHLVVRTGLHEWTFFSWEGFAEIEKFSAIGKPYEGEVGAPFGFGTQICAVSGDKIMVGTGTHLDNGTSRYWIVSATGEHDLIAGPRVGTDFYESATGSSTEGQWVRTGEQFAHWAIGTHPGDSPFDGSGWVSTVVGQDFATVSVAEANADPDNQAVGPLTALILGDDADTGHTFEPDIFTSNLHILRSNPFTGNPKPDADFNPSSGKSCIEGSAVFGTPGKIWRVVTDGGVLHVELCTPSMVKLASVSLSPTFVLDGWVADVGQALVVGSKAWHIVEGVDDIGNPTLSATDVSSIGVLPYVIGTINNWSMHAQFSGWVFGNGIHLVNRAF